MSQAELAERAGVSRQTISNYEVGFTTPRPGALRLLALATGVSYEWLRYGWTPDGPTARPKGLEPPTSCFVAPYELALAAAA